MRIAVVVPLLLLSLSTFAAEPIDPDVLKLREAAWRAWFAGDEAALRAMLPENFLGISMSGPEITDREKTLAASRAFKESGGRLVSLSFPETRAQRFGDTVVFYGSYEVTLFAGGKETTLRGRLTEVFVKRDGTWVHPGWHLDLQ
jgi:ketosteroid isomerase-like protein